MKEELLGVSLESEHRSGKEKRMFEDRKFGERKEYESLLVSVSQVHHC